METGQFAREVEAQSGAGDVTVLRGHETAESSEQTVHLLWGDAEAVIDDSDTRDALAHARVAADLTAMWREFDRVVEEIPHDRLDPPPVDIDEHAAVRQA